MTTRSARSGRRMCFPEVAGVPKLQVIVEGKTELAFVKQVLSPHLASKGVTAWPTFSDSGPGTHKWPRIRRQIAGVLKSGNTCTTMFDFYGMHGDWPGRRTLTSLEWEDKCGQVEKGMRDSVQEHLGSDFDDRKFIPYVQMHEFEAILFADVDLLAKHADPMVECQHAVPVLRKALEASGSPEAIDDGYNT